MLLEINKKTYHICPEEYNVKLHPIYNNLIILSNLDFHERIIGLLNEFSEWIPTCVINNPTHGGFISINLNFETIILTNIEPSHLENIKENKIKFNKTNLYLNKEISESRPQIFYSETDVKDIILDLETIYIIPANIELIMNNNFKLYKLTNSNLFIFISFAHVDKFKEIFRYFIKNDKELDYDNLIHLCMIVKDSGELLRDILIKNYDLIDEWTIIDTGSTDGKTMEIIKEVLVNKKGKLIENPFINFGKNRNECLDLAGNTCKYLLTLDDSYVIRGDLRRFLNEIRGDQRADSYSLFINSADMLYTSNRAIKSDRNLRYLYRIHEVIQDKDNFNVIIPYESIYIEDIKTPEMQKRTIERKTWDLEQLFEEIKENPMDPRHYYYIGQTYSLLEKYDLAYEYFMKRFNHMNDGLIYEKIDALFEAARIANFRLKKEWSVCLDLYLKVFELDKTRADALYYIGIHYLQENNNEVYKYLVDAFKLGYPINAQFSVRPTIYYYYIPVYLVQYCYINKDYSLGLNVCRRFLDNFDVVVDKITDQNPLIKKQEMEGWYSIYHKLSLLPSLSVEINFPKNKPILCLLADGGYGLWSGSNILKNGMGGSETFIVEMASHLTEKYEVYVFCNCAENETYNGVNYRQIKDYYYFIMNNYIESCIISRYSEYLPVSYKGLIENVYFILHDLGPSIGIIADDYKLKNVFCLTQWHVEYFLQTYGIFKNKTIPLHYGINEKFIMAEAKPTTPYSFIYSSFPNRGLLILLKMWKEIIKIQPLASLNIYCNLEQEWVNKVYPEMMSEIKKLLKEYPAEYNIINHGWVDKETLSCAWKKAEYWLYPCIFLETFCLTALECAASKTIAITSDLGALSETVGDRGYLIKGDPNTKEWQTRCLCVIGDLMMNKIKNKDELIEKNWKWAKERIWKDRAKDLFDNILSKNELEYKFMGNWTSDVPQGTKDFFNKELQDFRIKHDGRVVNILEIGTYTGTSIIKICQLMDNLGEVYVIDQWKNYDEDEKFGKIGNNIEKWEVEKSFYKNIKTAGLEDKIRVYKGKSDKMLLKMVSEAKEIDLIYVDASHNKYDCFMDMKLAWNILTTGGYLIIDDVGSDTVMIEMVNYFINEKRDKIRLISENYRVFLEKTD
jgi:predicted O-methyltransferase YrrM